MRAVARETVEQIISLPKKDFSALISSCFERARVFSRPACPHSQAHILLLCFEAGILLSRVAHPAKFIHVVCLRFETECPAKIPIRPSATVVLT